MPICGPNLSLVGMLISAWGIIQLALMGVFYYTHALAFVEDLPEIKAPANISDIDRFYDEMDTAYTQNAYNCWVAAALYVVTLAFSGHQFWANNRSSLNV